MTYAVPLRDIGTELRQFQSQAETSGFCHIEISLRITYFRFHLLPPTISKIIDSDLNMHNFNFSFAISILLFALGKLLVET